MDTNDFARRSGATTLEGTLKTLAKSTQLKAELKQHFGDGPAQIMERLMVAGKFEGKEGDKLHDFLMDEILNSAEECWGGQIAGEYSVTIREYEKVFFVDAVEHDPAGYFLNRQDAKDYILANWDNVEES